VKTYFNFFFQEISCQKRKKFYKKDKYFSVG